MAAETPPERRPLASRDAKASRALASWLARHGASPNAISVAGMLCGVAAGAALWATGEGAGLGRPAWIAAAALVQLRLLANMLDGMVAIETGRTSPLGEIFNEVPDRVSDAAILVGLGYSAGGRPEIGWALALAAVFTAYVRAEGRVAGAAQDYCGPLAKPQRMFGVTVIALWCGLAPGEWIGGVPTWGALVLLAGTAATAVRRLHRIGLALRR